MKRLIFLLFAIACLTEPLAAQSVFKVGEKAPNFTVEMLDGQQVKRSKLRGKVVLLSFWATWCRPCLRELTEIPDKILKPLAGKPFAMIAISKGEPRVTVEKKVGELKARGVEFPVGLDPYDKFSQMLGEDNLPQLLVIDAQGIVRYHEMGYTPERLDEVAALIETLLPR